MSSTGPTLRDLARAYAKGELAHDAYRRSRSALITSILAGEIEVRNIEFPPPIAPPSPDSADPTEPRPRRRSASAPAAADSDITAIVGTGTGPRPPRAPATAPPETGKSKWIVAGIVTLGVIAGAGYFLNPAGTGDAAMPAGDETATTPLPAPLPAPVAVDPLAEAGSTLIGNFMEDRSWSPERLAAFRSDWSMLTLEQQAAALRSTEAGRLASAIYQRLLEERAVSGLGDAEASLAKQRELVGFAAAIGISDPRLTVPEPAAAAVEPASPGTGVPE